MSKIFVYLGVPTFAVLAYVGLCALLGLTPNEWVGLGIVALALAGTFAPRILSSDSR